MRASICVRSAAVSLFFSTSLSSCLPTIVRPRSAMSRPMSASVTVNPCATASWVMPRPIWPAPMTPTRWMPSRTDMARVKVASEELDRQRDPLASTDAEGGDPALFSGRLERREQGDQHARARGPDRVAERHRAPPDIYPRGIETQHPVVGDRDDREGFIDLPQVDVILLPADLAEQALDRPRRRGGEPLRRLRVSLLEGYGGH